MSEADVLAFLGGIMKQVQQNYPQFANLMSLPGIAPVLVNAATQGWSPGQIQAAIQNTSYWKSTTAQERAFDLLQATDPDSARQAWQVGSAHVWDVLAKLGLDNVPHAAANQIVVSATRGGWDDRTITGWALLAMRGRPLPDNGAMGAAVSSVRGAANEYGVNMSDAAAFQYASDMAQGRADQTSIENDMRRQAIQKYGTNNPQLVDALNRGQTLRQYADPYIQTASQMLGVSPDSVDLTQPKWNSFLQPDQQTGQPMNMSQWQQTIRSDPTYGWDTSQDARDSYSKTASQIAQTFGAVG